MPRTSPSPSKTTDKQAEALAAMRSCLLCQLCDKRMTEPATLLACAHSFCHGCILKYTENSWTCPLMGCGTPVTMKGGSRESIKKNHLISAVASSVQNIEQIIATGPANWWVGQKGNEQNSSEVQFDGDDAVVDFQMMMDLGDKKRKREGDASQEEEEDGDEADDASSATKEYIIDEQDFATVWAESGGCQTMSLDQSLFPSEDASAKFDQQCAAPPDFSCSPIAVQSSQPEPNCCEEDGKQTNPGSASIKLGRVLRPTAQNSNENSANVQLLDGASGKRSSSNKTKLTSIFTLPDRSSLGKRPPTERKSGRARVSFQQQPRVMLLNPSWTMSNAHTRCLRKCATEGSISMLQINSNDDQFDSGFDFDTQEGRELFLTTLSSDRTSNCPPAPMSFYAISTERDESFSFGDEAITVPRSFPYYLAVACGLPIVDIQFLSSAANRRRHGATNRQRYLFPSPPRADEKKREGNEGNERNEYRVLGASDYSWGAPEKARTAALERHSLWQKEEGPHARAGALLPGTDLLRGCSVMLLGEFDQPNRSKRTVAKRKKRRDSEINGGGYCTHGNISLLLQLCGADVYDIDSVATPKNIKKGLSAKQWSDIRRVKPSAAPQNGPSLDEALRASAERGSEHNNIAVMVKDKSDLKLGSEFLHQFNSVAKVEVSQIPTLTCQWLLDSIGEFEVKDMSEWAIQD